MKKKVFFNGRVWLVQILLMLIFLTWSASVNGDQARYYYDALGRLVAVSDGQGNMAAYRYDSTGNILTVQKYNTAVTGIGIFLFAPNQGGQGSTVEIRGYGFDITASNNQVSFNGTPANVVFSTTDSIFVTVPNNATTGPVMVTNSNGTATSSDNFTVLPAPVIQSINPGSFAQGTTNNAVISGMNLTNATTITFSSSGISGFVLSGGTSTTLPISVTVSSVVPVGQYTFSVNTPIGISQNGIINVVMPVLTRVGVKALEPSGNNLGTMAFDPATNSLYAARSGFNNDGILYQLNLNDFSSVSTFSTGWPSVYGLTVDTSRNYVYASVQHGTIAIFRFTSSPIFGSPLNTGNIYDYYGQIAQDQLQNYLYLPNAADGNTHKFNLTDMSTDQVVTTPRADGVLVDNTGTFVYVGSNPLSNLYKLSISPYAVVSTLNMGIANPTVLDMDSSGFLYVGTWSGADKIHKINTSTMSEVATFPAAGTKPYTAFAVDKSRNLLIYVSSGSPNTVGMVDLNTFTELKNITLNAGEAGLTANYKTDIVLDVINKFAYISCGGGQIVKVFYDVAR